MNFRVLVATFFATVPAAGASAGVVEYDTDQREQRFTDVGGPANVSTVDFTGYPDFTLIADQWAHLGVHFSGSVATSGPSQFLYPNDDWGIAGSPDINVTFDEPIAFIAGDFPGYISIELYVNDELYFDTGQLGIGGPDNFGGLISDIPFDRARIYDPQDGLVVLDDLHFGPPINVPAPSGLLVLCSAAPVRRRRRR